MEEGPAVRAGPRWPDKERPKQGATFGTSANNACLAAAPNLVLVVMLGTGTEGQFPP